MKWDQIRNISSLIYCNWFPWRGGHHVITPTWRLETCDRTRLRVSDCMEMEHHWNWEVRCCDVTLQVSCNCRPGHVPALLVYEHWEVKRNWTGGWNVGNCSGFTPKWPVAVEQAGCAWHWNVWPTLGALLFSASCMVCTERSFFSCWLNICWITFGNLQNLQAQRTSGSLRYFFYSVRFWFAIEG